MPIHTSRILFEDAALLAVEKRSQELVVAGRGQLNGPLPLLDYLRKTFPGIHPLQRLDFETSGVVIFAKSRFVLRTVIDGGFRGWVKRYRTIVEGRVDREKGDIRLRLPARSGRGEAEAHTAYRVLERFPACTYVEAALETGRHHQIRRHFAMIGHPLVLDSLYGHQKFNRAFGKRSGYRKFFLHASLVSLPHPMTGQEVQITASPPRTFEEMLMRLRGGT